MLRALRDHVKIIVDQQAAAARGDAVTFTRDYYAGNKTLYVTALQNQMAIFSPDGNMPSDGPASVLSIEQQTNTTVAGKNIDLSMTYTNDFTSKATG